jgi:hypothetical protein
LDLIVFVALGTLFSRFRMSFLPVLFRAPARVRKLIKPLGMRRSVCGLSRPCFAQQGNESQVMHPLTTMEDCSVPMLAC